MTVSHLLHACFFLLIKNGICSSALRKLVWWFKEVCFSSMEFLSERIGIYGRDQWIIKLGLSMWLGSMLKESRELDFSFSLILGSLQI
ncbi:hypothetical protein Peur_015352 [Populus x canadensis]